MKAKAPFFAAFVLSLSLSFSTVQALEIDTYLTWDQELPDSMDLYNDFMNQEAEAYLEKVNKRKKTPSCQKFTTGFFRHLHFLMIRSKVTSWFPKNHPERLFPDESIGLIKHWRQSIYRGLSIPMGLMPLSRIVNLNGIYIGLDKLGHFFGRGRAYYVDYHKGLKKRMTPAEALEEMLQSGTALEYFFLGQITDGVLSNGDLEANFLGFEWGQTICESETPYFELSSEGDWRLVRPIEMRDHTTPRMDESFNDNFYAEWRWNKVRPRIEEEHCPKFFEPSLQARFQRYRAMDPHPTPVEAFTMRYFAKKNEKENLRDKFSIEKLCSGKSQSMLY
jgi:hypothetical protein